MEEWVAETRMALSAIPAPPFGEGPRGERMAELFREVGLCEVRTDAGGTRGMKADYPSTTEWSRTLSVPE